jgi:hypothetical protein
MLLDKTLIKMDKKIFYVDSDKKQNYPNNIDPLDFL